jgi:2-dehydropantoate 2-reductase
VSRYIVYGAGAIGGAIGSRLALSGQDVALIARGPHLDAIAAAGLRYTDPAGSDCLALDVFARPGQVRWRPGDMVILAMKSQDTQAALLELAPAAGPATPVVCAQNGIENERMCARLFEHVYGLHVLVPAAHLEAGTVVGFGDPSPGILDAGRYPDGVDDTARAIARDLASAGFSSRPVADIMRWKAAKLLANLANAIEAAWGTQICEGELYELARLEGTRCLTAAGIEFATADEVQARRRGLLRTGIVQGLPIQGGSTWQSVARGAAASEADFLNGEIALLGRLTGIPTPVNAALQVIVRDMLARGDRPGSVPMSVYEDLCRRGERAPSA